MRRKRKNEQIGAGQKKSRPAVSREVKLQLYREAGNKCANPGCPSKLVELHHIREWHVYKTHDAKHMIAVCPTCHTHAHHGELRIDELTIRSWKRAVRKPTGTGYLYVEPGPPTRVMMGDMFWTRKDDQSAIIFRLSDRNYVAIRVITPNILFVSLRLSGIGGELIAEIRENHLIFAQNEGITLESRPGRLRLSVSASGEFVSPAIIEEYEKHLPGLVRDGRITLLDLHVVDIGIVEVEGVWVEHDCALISRDGNLSIRTPQYGGFVHWRGYSEVRGDRGGTERKLPVMVYDGPLEISVIAAMLQNGRL